MDKTNKLELFLAEKEKKKEEKKIVMFSDKVYKFNSVKDASEELKIDARAISGNVNKKTRFVTDKTGLKVKFMRKLEYDKLTQDNVKSILAEIDGMKLILLNTGQEFNSVNVLVDYINSNKTAIYNNLNGKKKSCGHLNGENV